jgi:putative intracellular protease/amidase
MSATNERIAADHHMRVDRVSSKPKKVLIVVANPTKATTVGWPVGFWGAELTHPYYELTERGVKVTIASPDGGKVEMDALSDPRDPSKWSSEDLITMGFVNTPELVALLEGTPRLSDLELDEYDAIMIAGGLAPMFSYRDREDIHDAIRHFYESEKPTANYVQGGLFKAFTVRDGRLLTGQQQYSGRKVAQMLIKVLGI